MCCSSRSLGTVLYTFRLCIPAPWWARAPVGRNSAAAFCPRLGGVHLVEVTKSLYAPVGPAAVPSAVRAVQLNPIGDN